MVILLDIAPGQVLETAAYEALAGVPVKCSHTETDILAATHIIVPPVNDIKKSIRFLHLHNIFNMLRIIDKPVLGIGPGIKLMCEFADDQSSQACLGLFQSVPHIEPAHEMKQGITLLKADPLLEGLMGTTAEVQTYGFSLPVTLFTLAVFSVSGNSAILRNNNYSGLAFDPLQAGTTGKQLLANFVRL